MFYKFRKNKKAFTLVELIVVIAIIAILGTVVGVSVTGFVNNAKKRTVDTAADSVLTTWNLFVADGNTSEKWGTYLANNMDNLGTVNITYDGTGVTANTTATQAFSATGTIVVKDKNNKYTAKVNISNGKPSVTHVS